MAYQLQLQYMKQEQAENQAAARESRCFILSAKIPRRSKCSSTKEEAKFLQELKGYIFSLDKSLLF